MKSHEEENGENLSIVVLSVMRKKRKEKKKVEKAPVPTTACPQRSTEPSPFYTRRTDEHSKRSQQLQAAPVFPGAWGPLFILFHFFVKKKK